MLLLKSEIYLGILSYIPFGLQVALIVISYPLSVAITPPPPSENVLQKIAQAHFL